MSSRSGGRVAPCTPADARARLRKAQSFITDAELVLELGDQTGLDLPAVGAALSVLAGIAAADAACCSVLGERSRGQDHRQVEQLVATVLPHGPQMAKDLRRLLERKDNAHYGVISLTENEARDMVGWAKRMVGDGQRVVHR